MLERLVERFRFSIEALVRRFDVPRSGCLHVGANFGQEADSYDRTGFERVVWVEGYAPYYSRLKQELAGRPNHIALNLMVSDTDGERVTFSVASNTGSSTALPTTQSWQRTFKELRIVHSETITCGRLDRALCDALEPQVLRALQFLVLDIEGSELKALQSMGELLANVRYALIEVSVRRMFRDGPLLKDIDRFMLGQSFERIYLKMGAGSGDALYRRVTKVGRLNRVRTHLSARALQILAAARITDGFALCKNWMKRLVLQP